MRSRSCGGEQVEGAVAITSKENLGNFTSLPLASLSTSLKDEDSKSFLMLRYLPLILLGLSVYFCGYSGAVSASPPAPCTSDYNCPEGYYCHHKYGRSYCLPCLDCKDYNRELGTRKCVRSRADCGACLPGHVEIPPHCSRQAALEQNEIFPNMSTREFVQDSLFSSSHYGIGAAIGVCSGILVVALAGAVFVYPKRHLFVRAPSRPSKPDDEEGAKLQKEYGQDDNDVRPCAPPAPNYEHCVVQPNEGAARYFRQVSQHWKDNEKKFSVTGIRCDNLQHVQGNPGSGWNLANLEGDNAGDGDFHNEAPANPGDNDLLGLLENELIEHAQAGEIEQVPEVHVADGMEYADGAAEGHLNEHSFNLEEVPPAQDEADNDVPEQPDDEPMEFEEEEDDDEERDEAFFEVSFNLMIAAPGGGDDFDHESHGDGNEDNDDSGYGDDQRVPEMPQSGAERLAMNPGDIASAPVQNNNDAVVVIDGINVAQVLAGVINADQAQQHGHANNFNC